MAGAILLLQGDTATDRATRGWPGDEGEEEDDLQRFEDVWEVGLEEGAVAGGVAHGCGGVVQHVADQHQARHLGRHRRLRQRQRVRHRLRHLRRVRSRYDESSLTSRCPLHKYCHGVGSAKTRVKMASRSRLGFLCMKGSAGSIRKLIFAPRWRSQRCPEQTPLPRRCPAEPW